MLPQTLCARCKVYPSGPTNSSYCRDCWRQYQNDRNHGTWALIVEQVCERCALVYLPKQRNKGRFCSRDCKSKTRYERLRQERNDERKKNEARVCLYCNIFIDVTMMRKDAKFCSAQCNSRAHSAGRRKKVGDRYSPVFKALLVARDGFECGICGHVLDLSTQHPDPRFASVDHILPLSKGGGHDMANLRLACLTCNCSRGARC